MKNNQLFMILGNQLFPTKNIKRYKNSTFFMCEDFGLCTTPKHHKLKLVLFLSSMRSYAEILKKERYKLKYFDLSDRFEIPYEIKLEEFIIKKGFKELISFEIEDKFFEKKILDLGKKNSLKIKQIKSPMFLMERQEFKDYLSKNKRPFMANFCPLQWES